MNLFTLFAFFSLSPYYMSELVMDNSEYKYLRFYLANDANHRMNIPIHKFYLYKRFYSSKQQFSDAFVVSFQFLLSSRLAFGPIMSGVILTANPVNKKFKIIFFQKIQSAIILSKIDRLSISYS